MSLRTVADDTSIARRVGDVARADGLGRLDVLLHDGPQDGGFAVVEHADCTLGLGIGGAAG